MKGSAHDFSAMVSIEQTKENAKKQASFEIGGGKGEGTAAPELFGGGGGGGGGGPPRETLHSGGDPFAGTMPPPSGIKYEYTPMDGGNVGSSSSFSSSRPSPPDATDMPDMPGGGVKMGGGPQPVNPDDLLGVDKQFLPSHAAAPATSDGAPSGFGTSGGGGIASYQTQPL
jgi:hypothetical protein